MLDTSNIRVLIADDHKMVRDGLHALLARQPGIDVVGEADGGASAVSMARNLRPDVVIMDVAMPGISGIDATREITHDLIGVKVIALSMHNNASFVSKMIDAGAAGYILKDCA
ncbi:response regulator transcription factor, partial [bacterium]|nr:response regulator transcription factor [bacterium]